MQQRPKKLITVAGWEDRFVLGIERILESDRIQQILLFYFDLYEEQTRANRRAVHEKCDDYGIELEEIKLHYNEPGSTWTTLKKWLHQEDDEVSLINLTTMPRDTIWISLSFLRNSSGEVQFFYDKPTSYGEVLTFDPARPRFVIKHSGIIEFARKTALVVITGFDPERTRQLITIFQPDVVVLGFQKGAQFENRARNQDAHLEVINDLRSGITLKTFELDCYAVDEGAVAISSVVKRYADTHNIILNSLGPKLSAIALYRVWEEFPSAALSYVPSRGFSPSYSTGLGKQVRGPVFSS